MTDCIFLKWLMRPGMLCELSSLVTEATNSGLKLFLGLVVKCSCLEVPSWCSSTLHMKSAALLAAAVFLAPLGSVELVVFPRFLERSRLIPWQKLLADKSVAHM